MGRGKERGWSESVAAVLVFVLPKPMEGFGDLRIQSIEVTGLDAEGVLFLLDALQGCRFELLVKVIPSLAKHTLKH